MSDVCLVAMPYETLELPSIGLSSLVASAKVAGIDAMAIYGKFWFAENIGFDRYVNLSKFENTDDLLSEWTFAGAAFPGFSPDPDKFFEEKIDKRESPADFYTGIFANDSDKRTLLWEIRTAAIEFVTEAATRILELNPRVVGCGSTFQQNCASLALLRKVKEINPNVVTMMGGANCEGIMGLTIKRAFKWVDFVVSGEADLLFPGLCRDLLEKGTNIAPEELPQGVFSETNIDKFGPADDEPTTAKVFDMDKVPTPDFDDYFKQLNEFKYKNSVYPCLLMETSRGCWWGERKSCLFCGLNGDSIKFRSKSAKRVLNEINYLQARHSISNFRMTDNILDMKYFKSVLPELAAKKSNPVMVFYEIKTNLTERQIILLSDAGVRWVQPGIESLDDRALKSLGKGNSTINNIALLKFAMENGINSQWLFLCGFPGEDEAWYKDMTEWLPMIYHLQPPNGMGINSVRFDRFNTYNNNRDSFGLNLTPNMGYKYIYPLSARELEDLAYFFSDDKLTRQNTLEKSEIKVLNNVVKEWQYLFRLYPIKEKRVLITVEDDGKQSRIIDTRPCAVEKSYVLTGLHRLIYQRCREPRSRDGLPDYFKDNVDIGVSVNDINNAIDDMVERKLMLSLNGKLLSLALKEPQRPLMTKRNFLTGCKVGQWLIQ